MLSMLESREEAPRRAAARALGRMGDDAEALRALASPGGQLEGREGAVGALGAWGTMRRLYLRARASAGGSMNPGREIPGTAWHV